jgi:hypothetical protein
MLRKLLLFIIVAFGILGTAWADNSVGVPDVHIGDMWKYRSIDGYTDETKLEFSHRIVKLNDKEIIIQIRNKNKSARKLQFLTREWNPTDIDGTKFEPFYPEYKFPMNVGYTWKQEFRSLDTHGSSFSSFVRAKVVALEKVTVPAGTFDTYRIERDIETRSSSADANVITAHIITWYAPVVKKYIRRELTYFSNGRERDKNIDELLEYSLQEKSVVQAIDASKPASENE